MKAFGGADALVNNTGIMDSTSAVADVTDGEWERRIRINLTAPFLFTRAVLPHMLRAGRGSIVFTASEASLRGSARPAYTAAKHGVVGLTKSLVTERFGRLVTAWVGRAERRRWPVWFTRRCRAVKACPAACVSGRGR
jgi:NAD(P)-dependent dehydrogenase (short-subunit alcohol dehydrogenase family)